METVYPCITDDMIAYALCIHQMLSKMGYADREETNCGINVVIFILFSYKKYSHHYEATIEAFTGLDCGSKTGLMILNIRFCQYSNILHVKVY